MEELRQREANATALQAIGPRKKPRLDGDAHSSSSQVRVARLASDSRVISIFFFNFSKANAGGFNSGLRGQMPLRQRMKKVTLRDLQFLFETEKDLCKSKLLYKSYLKWCSLLVSVVIFRDNVGALKLFSLVSSSVIVIYWSINFSFYQLRDHVNNIFYRLLL